jgi:hypothetical protein
MKFNDIPQFTKTPDYHVDTPWWYLPDWIAKRDTLVDLNFQRLHVWTETQQIAYVEYILRGGKSGRDLYFNQADWMGKFKAPMYIVDGKQRLNAVQRFLNNEIPAFGSYYRDFEDNLPSDVSFTIHVNDLKTYREVVTWYLEMNTGGTPHTEEEIAKARALLDAAPADKV